MNKFRDWLAHGYFFCSYWEAQDLATLVIYPRVIYRRGVAEIPPAWDCWQSEHDTVQHDIMHLFL